MKLADGKVTLHAGDCLEVLAALAENSIDAVVTDPPYELGFMGKSWDASGIAFCADTWRLVWRVLKPGAHLVAFGAPKNYHRLACAIEDAGFEIRDSLMWVFGSGFPKSHNLDGDWSGWGTALKPAYEPIVLARKPLSEKTVAANVLRWGTGALNIDATRISTDGEKITPNVRDTSSVSDGWNRPWMADKDKDAKRQENAYAAMQSQGRWPANLCHDGSQDVLDLFPQNSGANGGKGKYKQHAWLNKETELNIERDKGSAARFFYCAKAGKQDRAGSKHPTVKPINLMRWLVRMVTPPGGTVLDPFAGSGTTGLAANLEGYEVQLIERELEYQDDIRSRFNG